MQRTDGKEERLYGLDWLRIIAFALLILYHLGMLYVGEWEWHIKSAYLQDWLQWPMLAMNRWRMELLFMISGLAIGLYAPARHPGRFVRDRTVRHALNTVDAMAAEGTDERTAP